jgi:hypothetical protein
MCERGQKASPTPDLPIPAAKVDYHTPKPCLVQRHYLHSSAAWVLVSGGNHGLGDPQGVSMAAIEHIGASFCPLGRLLCNRLPAMVEALNEAVANYGKPEIMNTDRHMMFSSSRVGCLKH